MPVQRQALIRWPQPCATFFWLEVSTLKLLFMKKWSYLLLLIALSCTKQDLKSDCKSLKEGITSNDVNRVNSSISKFIGELSNKIHTNENLTSLAKKISAS